MLFLTFKHTRVYIKENVMERIKMSTMFKTSIKPNEVKSLPSLNEAYRWDGMDRALSEPNRGSRKRIALSSLSLKRKKGAIVGKCPRLVDIRLAP